MINKKWLTTTELSTYLGISKNSIYSRIQRGTLPHSKMERTLIFDREEIDKLLKRNFKKTLTSNKKGNTNE